MQYQTKVPINTIFPETTQYHGQDRQLIDAYQAVALYKQLWPSYTEYSMQL